MDITNSLNIGSEPKELKIGASFHGSSKSAAFHTIRYDFKPASVDKTKVATVDVGEHNEVTVAVPHVEGSGTVQTIYKGSKRPYQKECLLIFDHETGEVTLEKLSSNVHLKKTRSETSSKGTSEHSKSSYSPSTHRHSPVLASPIRNHRSPASRKSPSMPALGSNMPVLGSSSSNNKDVTIADLSESSSSESGSSSGSSSSGSDSESEIEKKLTKALPPTKSKSNSQKLPLPDVIHKGPSAQNHRKSSSSSHSHMSSMPSIDLQLQKDLQLSESGSDSD